MELVEPYPADVLRVPGCIGGTAFFPGGAGLWKLAKEPIPDFPVYGVMVLGQDFHSEDGFWESFRQGTEVSVTRTVPTWQQLLPLLEEAAIPLKQCFFTNAYMGLRQGSTTTGPFPGARDAAFLERCRRFLLRQVEAQQPAMILALGKWVPHHSPRSSSRGSRSVRSSQ
jgi:hypothetical protein